MGQSLQPGYDLIITNGDSAGEILRRAYAGTEVLPWRDVLHEGPVPLTDSHEELSQTRADFLGGRNWEDRAALLENFKARDRGLAHHETFETVTLWFEHDLYDQLQLIQILDWFAANPRSDGALWLVQAQDFLGTQTPESITEFAKDRKPVSAAQLTLARTAWSAFRQPAPEAWAGLLNQDLSALPSLENAVRRMLQELPALGSGLSRTQHQILMAINDGAETPPLVFAAAGRLEEAAFMGDWSFWGWLDGLASNPGRLIEGLEGRFSPALPEADIRAYLASTLRLNTLGLQVLAGAADYTKEAPIDRWAGGTHLTNDNLWRWDNETGKLAPPA